MDQINASKSGSITTDDNATPWHIQTVRGIAQAEIAESFDALTAIGTPYFERFGQLRKDGRHEYNGISGCPKDTLMTMLLVGVYDGTLKGQQGDFKPSVYAYIHGAKMNQVGYCYKVDNSTVVRLREHNLPRVDFVEPFCDVQGSRQGSSTIVRLLKSTVLYYFLASAYIPRINDYRTFWLDFKQACDWIANKSSRPTLQTIQSTANVTPEDETDAKFVPSLSPHEHAAVDDAVAPKKRQRQDGSETSEIERLNDAQPARQVHGNITGSSSPDEPLMIRSLEARIKRLKDANALLRTQNKQLTTETARLEEHRAYVRNAYDGLKHKHDHLLTGHPKTMARALAAENKAKESAANAAMWQARAEQAKQQIVDVQTKHDALRTTIRGHIREVSNELLDLSDRV